MEPPPATAQHSTPCAEESQVQRPGRAQRRAWVRGPPMTITEHSTPTRRQKTSAAARPSAAGKGSSGVSPGYGNPTRTHAEKGQAERNGQAERSGEGRVRGSPPTTTQHSTPTRRRKPSAATIPRAAEKEGSGSQPTAPIKLACTSKKAKPSAAARPSAAEKGVRGLPRLRQSKTHAGRRRPSRAQRLGREGGFGCLP